MHCRTLAWALMTVFAADEALAEMPPGATPMKLISAPALSPDGKTMIFEWSDDLWTASSAGGEAKRIVEHPAHDSSPKFSPDGQRIVFNSDRSGSPQVYSMPAAGGGIVQHTRHTEGNELQCLSPDGTRALVAGIREHPGMRAARLMEIDLTGDRRERRLFDANAGSAAWSPDGTRVLFCRGGGQLYRKGCSGARASRIWLYHIKDRAFECKVAGEADARSPLWLPDGSGFYYTSDENGTANLWLHKDGSAAVRLTNYDDDGVITPDLSADGSAIVFCHGLGVGIFRPETDKEPVALELWTRASLPDIATDTEKITGTASADFTGDLQQAVFAAAGDLWWLPAAGKAPVRLTETTAAEDETGFFPGGEWLWFLRDDGIEENYFRARFVHGAMQDETPITRGDRSKCRLKTSPDGMKIAWIEGTGDIFTAMADGGNPRRVFQSWDKPVFDWSPDGRWLAVAAEDRNSNRDIWLVPADGSREAVNLTCHPAFENAPKWSPDGRWLVFSARRGGTGKLQMWRIDFGKRGPAADLSAEAAPGYGDKAEMIPTPGIEPVRVIWADSKTLWFQDEGGTSDGLHSIEVDGSHLCVLKESGGVPIRMTADGSLLWRVDRTPEILTKSQAVRFPIAMTVSRPRQELLTLGFRRIWRTLGESFYDERMNGRDWKSLRLKYEAAARGARNSLQFGQVVNQLLGELNASHLAFTCQPWPHEIHQSRDGAATAHPGIIFRDDEEAGDAPLRIARVIAGSPVAMLAQAPKPGETVLRIAGAEVSNRTPLHPFFNGAENRPLPVVLRSADGGERVIELRCISYQKARSLVRQEQEASILARVHACNPEFAWIPVPNMNSDALEDLERRIYRASLGSQRLILDLRNNVGGREADRMLNWFCQPVHSFTVPRDGPAGYPIERRTAAAWDKPFVVLCNENTFSNAEIFCHAVKQIHRAPLVGTATAGSVISEVQRIIPDIGELQVPFRGWFLAGTRENMDLHGAQPDHPVDLTPADEDAGRDPQLEKALEVLRGL